MAMWVGVGEVAQGECDGSVEGMVLFSTLVSTRWVPAARAFSAVPSLPYVNPRGWVEMQSTADLLEKFRL